MDVGGHTIKAGFCCDNHPVSMFRNLVARPRNLKPPPYGHGGHYDVLIGDDAVLHGEDLDLCAAVEKGRIVHWDNLERIWHHIFYRELRVAPEDRGVMYDCSSYMPMSEKIRAAQVFFEVLNIPALCIQPTAVLSLYGSGLVTGCTIDMGYDTFDVDPVFVGSMVRFAHMDSGFAGRQMNDYIRRCLAERGFDFGYRTPYIIDDIIKKHVYVTTNAAMSRSADGRRSFVAPSGEEIDITNEAFLAGEMIFQPDLVLGKKAPYKSLTETICSTVNKCDTELKAELCSGIVMAGALSKIPNVAERLKQEVTDKMGIKVNVITADESYVLGWMGGALFAGIPEGERLWITRRQYDDHGERVIRNKFM
ncbi:actin domain-containing protein [Phthorimaea operculella]|nr:actin domain-containing protein [Phthorimaea operculella]